MRLLIKFKSTKDAVYNHYLYQLQGFIYSLIENTEYHELHDKKDIKYFCYSNIFPARFIKKDDIEYMMIDTPNLELANVFLKSLQDMKEKQQIIKIVDYSFKIDIVNRIDRNIKAGDWIETSTPIILRYENEKTGNRIFWGDRKCDKNIFIFMKNLDNNLLHKYSNYFNLDKINNDVFSIQRDFSELKFIKITFYPIVMNGKSYIHIGSKWKFKVSENISDKALEILNFCFQTGFGGNCSMGFGFINKETR